MQYLDTFTINYVYNFYHVYYLPLSKCVPSSYRFET